MTFNEANKENVEKSRLIHEGLLDPTDYEKKYTLLRKYLTRGGFIKDRNGKWCKEGDLIKFYYCVKTRYGALCSFDEKFTGKLMWDKENSCFKNGSQYGWLPRFELIEPCEPDICKDFEEVEL